MTSSDHGSTAAAVVWVFNGAGGTFPSAVFRSRERANDWIRTNRLTGVLTAYPLDVGVYDWAVGQGLFTPKRADQRRPAFVQRFSSAYLEHHHYEEGVPAEEADVPALASAAVPANE